MATPSNRPAGVPTPAPKTMPQEEAPVQMPEMPVPGETVALSDASQIVQPSGSESTDPGLLARIQKSTESFVAPDVETSDTSSKKPGVAVDANDFPAGGIEVRARSEGYIYHSRKEAGSVFKIGSMDELGDWMECTHHEVEKEHQRLMKVRDRKIAALPKDTLKLGE